MTKVYKVVKRHDTPGSEGTQHLEEKNLYIEGIDGNYFFHGHSSKRLSTISIKHT